MVSEKPPRRSKVEKEPVTIDLTAEETSPVAEPVRSNDIDEPVTQAEKAAEDAVVAEEGKTEISADTAAAAPVIDDQLPAEPTVEDAKADAAIPPTGETVSEPAASFATDAATEETRADEPRSGFITDEPPKSATVAPEPEPSPSVKPRTSPATTTLVAAGIFGGIVALLLAGSMQYAGYLPGATPAPAANTSGLSSELTELRQEIATLKNRPAAAADGALANRVAALEAVPKAQGGASEQAVAALKTELDRLRATVQSSANADASLTQRMNQAEAKLNDRGPEQQVARAVAAAALKAAIDRGGSFETELQTFTTVAGDDPAVADLQKFAANGVPSRSELQRDFPRVADAMLEATVQPDPNQGIGGRLLASAMSVVKVRRVGDVQGDTPEAIVARLEEGLRNGNLQASTREWDSLPEPAKAVSREFKQKLDARIQVENLVGGTLTRAVAGTKG
ncbi:hypothetical protein KX729_20975 [Rhizobium sp. XQZ8]|uniref:COG4223 family protein n=1 Tax=Rhizobium populisoli TaxID=2859785 RepID=UPI001CA4D385|nr:mitofilin family membrane protein [Rhizobium populisoli]MBW6423939.1 hypothetical protein [Rhizobium populisoli]